MPKSQVSETKVKKKKGKVVPALVGIGILIGVGSLLFFSRHQVAKIVKDIPVLNQVFKLSDEVKDPYDLLTKDQLKEKIVSLEKDLEQATIKIGSLENDKVLLNEKMDALKQYEVQYNDFIVQKSSWDAEVAKAEPELFIKQFEAIYPDVAARIYEEIKGDVSLNKEQKDFATMISTMDAKKASEVLSTLIKTDPELTKSILKSMKKENQAAILNEMATEDATQMIKLISPSIQ